MTRAEAWLQHATNLVVGGTGLAYGWMLYFVPEDPDSFALTNHPWQPEAQGAHILFAPIMLFAMGLIWKNHVWRRFRANFKPHRKTGLCLMVLLVPMAASGYLLQVSSTESWRLVWIWLHGISSCLWILTYLVHQLAGRSQAPAEGA